jgi:2-polyprenyl-3-methyl-5-hydroxy-6-metoxy-1,4-benzoquinol methylase
VTTVAAFWKEHYAHVVTMGRPWLDSSNVRTQHQYFSVALEAAGDVAGNACLDIGCGHGQLAMTLQALGARTVTACDLMPTLVEANRRREPAIDWRQGDLLDPEFVAGLPVYDRVFVVEILQCVDIFRVLPGLWDRVSRGGRLIGTIANSHCPIVQRTVARYGGTYQAVDEQMLHDLARSLGDVELCAVRGLTFAPDQRIAPYALGPWNARLNSEPPPNRLNFVLLKSS